MTIESSSARDLVASHTGWYHTIDVADDVVTPGWTDLRHLRHVPRIPEDLSGKRALDCGMFDGFWSFELESRGAEVVGIDIDEVPPPDVPEIHRQRLTEEAGGVTPGTGFELLKEFFGSGVRRVSCDIREVTPEAIGGPVDVAFIGALLLHIRDPLRAIEAVLDTLRPDGLLILAEPVLRGRLGRRKDPVAQWLALEGGWTYWYPNRACLEHWLRTAGCTSVDFVGDGMSRGKTEPQLVVGVHARR